MSGLSTRSAARVDERGLDDVPHQHLVVGGDGRVGVVGRARPGSAATSRASAGRGRGGSPSGRRPGRGEPALERGAPVDADVAAGHVVVLVGERPVDGLGPAAGHRHGHRPAGPQHPGQLAHGGQCRRGCARAPPRRSPGRRCRRRTAAPARRPGPPSPGGRGAQLAGLHHGAERAAHLRHLVGPGVERHHRPRRGGPPRRRGARTRSRGRAGGRPAARRAGRSRRSASAHAPVAAGRRSPRRRAPRAGAARSSRAS